MCCVTHVACNMHHLAAHLSCVTHLTCTILRHTSLASHMHHLASSTTPHSITAILQRVAVCCSVLQRVAVYYVADLRVLVVEGTNVCVACVCVACVYEKCACGMYKWACHIHICKITTVCCSVMQRVAACCIVQFDIMKIVHVLMHATCTGVVCGA